MTSGFRIISRFDPALDHVAMREDGSAALYRETGDIRHVRLMEGATPTEFFCRRLKTSEMQAVKAHTSEADIYAACFARGLERVKALRADKDDDAPEDYDPRRDWVRPDPARPLSKAELDTFDPGDVFEIGAAIYGRSVLGKGKPAAWPQPDTSQLAILGLAVHRAERIARTGALSPQSKSDPAEPPPTTSGG